MLSTTEQSGDGRSQDPPPPKLIAPMSTPAMQPAPAASQAGVPPTTHAPPPPHPGYMPYAYGPPPGAYYYPHPGFYYPPPGQPYAAGYPPHVPYAAGPPPAPAPRPNVTMPVNIAPAPPNVAALLRNHQGPLQAGKGTESHTAFNQLLESLAQELQKWRRAVSKQAQLAVETGKPQAPSKEAGQLADAMKQKWHLEYLKKYVDGLTLPKGEYDTELPGGPEGGSEREFQAEIVDLVAVNQHQQNGPVYALEVTKRRYHARWGFYNYVRLTVTSDLRLSVQIDLRPYEHETDLESFDQFSAMVHKLSTKGARVVCGGIQGFTRYAPISYGKGDYQRSEFPEEDTAFHMRCKVWFRPIDSPDPYQKHQCEACATYAEELAILLNEYENLRMKQPPYDDIGSPVPQPHQISSSSYRYPSQTSPHDHMGAYGHPPLLSEHHESLPLSHEERLVMGGVGEEHVNSPHHTTQGGVGTGVVAGGRDREMGGAAGRQGVHVHEGMYRRSGSGDGTYGGVFSPTGGFSAVSGAGAHEHEGRLSGYGNESPYDHAAIARIPTLHSSHSSRSQGGSPGEEGVVGGGSIPPLVGHVMTQGKRGMNMEEEVGGLDVKSVKRLRWGDHHRHRDGNGAMAGSDSWEADQAASGINDYADHGAIAIGGGYAANEGCENEETGARLEGYYGGEGGENGDVKHVVGGGGGGYEGRGGWGEGVGVGGVGVGAGVGGEPRPERQVVVGGTAGSV